MPLFTLIAYLIAIRLHTYYGKQNFLMIYVQHNIKWKRHIMQYDLNWRKGRNI